MQVIKDLVQGSEEWLQFKCGKVSASNFSKVLAKGKDKTRKSYLYQLAAEIITGEPAKSFTNNAMEWGNECEPQARAMYELHSGNDVKEVGFVVHNDNVGVSPDGLIDHDGLVEIKCPNTATQIERYLSGSFPATYKPQVQGQLWVCERDWCDFVSFDPRIDGQSSYFCIRVQRDDEYIKTLEAEVNKFVKELIETVKKLRG